MIELDPEKLVPADPKGLSGNLRDDRAYEGLTAKQWHYVEARLKGLSVTEAYRQVYQPVNAAEATVWHNAVSVEGNPRVQERLRKRLLEVSGQSTLIPINDDFVLNGIAQLAVAGTKESTRLRGYELLGKALGLFDKKPEAEPELKTVTDVDAELRKRLAAALNPAVIDVEPELLGPSAPARPDRRRKPRSEPTGG